MKQQKYGPCVQQNRDLGFCAPCMQGRVAVPLREVQRRRRLRGTWQLEGVPSGTLSMELKWVAAAGMY